MAAIQQIALIPIFLSVWTNHVLAAWLVIYAAGNLALVFDAGLQFRAINRFLSFSRSADCDGRTASFYGALKRVYLGLAAVSVALLLAGCSVFEPSKLLGFEHIEGFDAAFVLVIAGTLLTLPTNLVAGLYRARGHYGRAVLIQSLALLTSQLCEVGALYTAGTLTAVALAYVAAQCLFAVYLLIVDVNRQFPFLRRPARRPSVNWALGQFRLGMPFAVASATELALLNLPVLIVSVMVHDRLAVAQWGLTRVAAGFLRVLCVQATLPLAAELGRDYAAGSRNELRHLYLQGSVLVTLLACTVVSGVLPFWQDFFALWTHGSLPYDARLTITLLLGTAVAAPSTLAHSFANYSNRADLLVRAKGLQLVLFIALAVSFTPLLGSLGAAIAIVASDLIVQFGILTVSVMRETLDRPSRHIGFLLALEVCVVVCGWSLGEIIRTVLPLDGFSRLAAECALWLAILMGLASLAVRRRVRERLRAWILR